MLSCSHNKTLLQRLKLLNIQLIICKIVIQMLWHSNKPQRELTWMADTLLEFVFDGCQKTLTDTVGRQWWLIYRGL